MRNAQPGKGDTSSITEAPSRSAAVEVEKCGGLPKGRLHHRQVARQALQRGRTKAKVARQLAVQVRRRVCARQPNRRLWALAPASANNNSRATCALRHLSEASIKFC